MTNGTGTTPPPTSLDTLEYDRPPFALVPFGLVRAGTGEQVRLYVALAAYANGRTRDGAFPGVPRLAHDLDRHERSVQRDLRALEAAGWLRIVERTRPNGSQTSNGYVLQGVAVLGGGGAGVTPPPVVSATPITTPTNNNQHLPLAPLARPAKPAPTAEPQHFAGWWQTYPRKIGKRAAMKAYVAALKRATPAALLDGARTYRDDPNREDAYTAHPSTWLNRDGWHDDALPARAGTRSPGSGTQAILDRAMVRAQAAEDALLDNRKGLQ